MNVGGWQIVLDGVIGHVIPLNDLKPHDAHITCACKPVQDEEEPSLYSHNSYDGREAIEEGHVRKC